MNPSQTVVSVGLASQAQGYATGREAARQALAGLQPGPISLVLLFTSHQQPAQVLKGVNDTLGSVLLIGATSAGEYTHQGYVEDGAGIMVIQAETIRFCPLVYQRRLFGSGKLLGRLQGTSETGLGSHYNHRALMLFPDDHSMSMDNLVGRVVIETAMLYDILGGPGPTIPATPRQPAVFINRHIIRSGLVGAELLSQRPVGMALANGRQPISGPYRVTQIDKRRVVKIDGRPAREVYEDFALERGFALSDMTPAWLMRYPVGLCVNGDCKVSIGLGFDANGALLVASPPPENSLIHILTTHTAELIDAAHRAVGEAVKRLDEPSAGLLLIDCMSTAVVLGEAHQQQRAAVEGLVGAVPFLGFRSHGVLARLQGQVSGHYECSVAACAFPR